MVVGELTLRQRLDVRLNVVVTTTRGRLVDQPLGRVQSPAAIPSTPGRRAPGLRRRDPRGNDAEYEADPLRFLRVDEFTGEHETFRDLCSDLTRQQPGTGTGVGNQPSLHEDPGEPGPGARDPEVGLGGEFDPEPGGRTVDRRDDGLRGLPQEPVPAVGVTDTVRGVP